MAARGHTRDDLPRMQSGMGPTCAASFACWFVMATVLALIAPHFGAGVRSTLGVGFHLWLGFSATVGLTNNLFSDKPLRLWFIDAGYQLASVAVMAVVPGFWR